jgi:hypothetical protein
MLCKTCLMSLLAVVLFAALGCSESLVTRQHYDMIMEGTSTKIEVEKTLGDTYVKRGSNEWEYDEEGRHLTVYVYFDKKGVVKWKEWIDGRTGEWDGAAPGIDEEPEGETASDESKTMTIKEP